MSKHRILVGVAAMFLGMISPATADLIVSIDHLAIPAVYDNAGGKVSDFGQTFLAVDGNIAGVRLYINDPSRPGNPLVNELTGPAELVLHSAADLNSPVELARDTVLATGAVADGLWTFLFDTPVPTMVGGRYFFSINAVDNFGLGLRSLTASTYAGGAEAFRSLSTGVITEVSSGRDLSFQVLTSVVPEPSSLVSAALGLTAFAGYAGWRRKRIRQSCRHEIRA